MRASWATSSIRHWSMRRQPSVWASPAAISEPPVPYSRSMVITRIIPAPQSRKSPRRGYGLPRLAIIRLKIAVGLRCRKHSRLEQVGNALESNTGGSRRLGRMHAAEIEHLASVFRVNAVHGTSELGSL